MNKEKKIRVKNAILGALVADSASLGLHWIYSQKQINNLEASQPEFHAPNENDYENAVGFFAHKNKKVGDLSHYGEQVMVLLRSLVSNNGVYDKTHYEDSFREHFGYGGAYVGYIDHPTRDTLDNISSAEIQTLENSKKIPFDGDENTQHMMITKVLANMKQVKGQKLYEKVEEAVRTTHDDDGMVEYSFKLIKEMEGLSDFYGSNDEQLPAISKLPALVAMYAGSQELEEVVESAVRVTNHNDLAVEFGKAAAHILEAVIQNDDSKNAIEASYKNTSPAVSKLIDEVLSHKDEETITVGKKIGTSCNLVLGIPIIVHNLATSQSYSEAIRKNIYVGGDSCGRSILLGAVLGASNGSDEENGIPSEWIEKLNQKEEIYELIEKLVNF